MKVSSLWKCVTYALTFGTRQQIFFRKEVVMARKPTTKTSKTSKDTSKTTTTGDSRLNLTYWSFIKDILDNKHDIWEEGAEKLYKSYSADSTLSNYPDTVLYANEMNRFPVAPKWNYYFYLNSIRSGVKRGYFKKDPPSDVEDLKLIQEAFGYSIHKAKETLSILSPEQLEEIRIRMDKGGWK